jgi:hypothetical protein
MMRALTALRSLLAPVAIGMALTGTALAPTSAHAEQFLSLYHRPDLKWYTIETEHFLVHYPVSRKSKDKAKHYVNGEWAARKVAKVSEQYYGPMCAEFDYYLEEKTHIVVLEQYDQLQGFTIPARNWVEISGNPGPTFYRSRSRSEWFSNVLVHEFAHVVSLKKNQATAENVPATLVSALYRNNALGQDGRDLDTESGAQLVITDRTEPWWWTEGGAEYWSSTTGYNWWTAGRERTVRNSVIEDRLLTYDEWKSTQFGILSWGDGERGYQQGHSIALYMRMRFGPEAFASFAIEADKAWRAHWETIIEEKTGVGARQLYDDWRAWIEDYYERMYDELVAEGEAVGRSLDADQGMRFDTPAERDRFFTRTRKVWGQERKEPKERIDWETQLDRTGSYEGWPKISEDGRWFGEGGRSLSITAQPERFIGAHGEPWRSDVANAGARANASFMTGVYPTGFVSGWDFVPGQDQVVAVMRENTIDRARKGFYAIDIETDGYDWDNLVLIDLEPFIREKVRHGDQRVELPTLRPKKRRGSGFDATYRQKPRMPFRVIPNTQRGTEPAVSPDGQTVAYLEYGDGTNNLVLIGLDGSNKRYMTEFSSGELIQSVDWSPDGKTLVFALFKNYKSDIWFMDVETGEVRPFTQDRLEELDVHWSPHDGNLYFAADHENIYNVYRYDFDTGRIDQLTNVISTAYMPHLTPSGDLLYMNYTAFGQKNYVLAQEEFLELDATERFDIDLDEAETGRAMADFAYTEDLSEFEPLTKRYASFRRFHPPAIIPIFRLRNPSLPTFALDTGVQVSSFDVGEKHEFLGVGIVGTNMVLGGGYTYRGWHPEISIFAQHAQTKADFGFLIDEDDDRSTLDDQEVYEFRQNTYQNALFLSANYALNQQLRLRGQVGVFEFGFRSINDKQFRPFNLSTTARLGFEFSNLNYGLQVGRLNFSRRGINPRGRYVTFDYTLGYTDHVSPNNNGVNTDDGERLDAYVYNRFDFRWTEHLPFPFVRRLRSSGHALQFDVQAAAIDRNVQLFDELRAGGGHPMMPGVGPGGVQPTQPLSGYPTVLLGETMAVASAYWRFPIKRNIQKKWGPLLMRDLYVQAGGSAGNLWSFQPPDEDEVGLYYFDNQGNRVAFDPDDVEREIPLVDRAYKNGNYLLTDVSAELRVSSVLMGTQFNSILRVSYGFNEVSGIFDIDGDDINDTTNAGFGNAISAETEKPGPRIYLGIGSGW